MEKCLILSIVVGRYSLGSGSIKPDTLNMQDNPRGGGVRKLGLRESYKVRTEAESSLNTVQNMVSRSSPTNSR